MHTLGHQRDAEHYLKLFSSGNPESFALIVAEADIREEDLDALILDLRYLLRLGLYPVLAFCAAPDRLASLDLPAYLKKMRLKALPLSLKADLAPQVLAHIRQASLSYLMVNREKGDASLIGVLTALQTKKLIFLNPLGAIFNPETHSPIGMVNLNKTEEVAFYDALLRRAGNDTLDRYRHMLRTVPHPLHIAVTSPLSLLRELFTVKGAGTLMYQGAAITKHDSLYTIDAQRMMALLESSFQKPLKYPLDTLAVDAIYLQDAYQGAAFIRDLGTMAYLSKFAVGLAARGLGVGRDLWQAVTADYPKLFWRAKPENFVSSWYAKVCDGMQKGPTWNVYWRGLAGPDRLTAIDYASRQPEDFA